MLFAAVPVLACWWWCVQSFTVNQGECASQYAASQYAAIKKKRHNYGAVYSSHKAASPHVHAKLQFCIALSPSSVQASKHTPSTLAKSCGTTWLRHLHLVDLPGAGLHPASRSCCCTAGGGGGGVPPGLAVFFRTGFRVSSSISNGRLDRPQHSVQHQ